jgi:hypothetical protein
MGLAAADSHVVGGTTIHYMQTTVPVLVLVLVLVLLVQLYLG